MRKRGIAAFLSVAAVVALVDASRPQKSASASKEGSTGVERELAAYMPHFLPFDPDSKVTAEKATETLPGFQGYKVHRKGRYEKLNLDKLVYVSADGKWIFSGDSVPNTDPRPLRGPADLDWINGKFSAMFRSTVRTQLAPERDAAGWKGVSVSLETGYGPVRMPGYVTPDGRYFLQGNLWDFHADPRTEKRRRIDLSASRASGPANASVQVVEYADLECGYCKYRGLQMDRLLEANNGVVNVRRHYKFFPLWITHVWSMKAASAADCIFRLSAPAMFRFKRAVYARQESMTVSGIDELAITTVQAEGLSSADFLSCYLQDDSFQRVKKDIEEGYRLSVISTPTYFIDGTEISWIEDKVMEDYLRTLFPKIRTIDYAR